jgi:hypothetical protein
MKTIALIGLILVTTAGMCMAAETSVTIQNHSTMRIDSITGKIKGDAQTQVKGITKHGAPQAVNTSPEGQASTDSTAVGTPVNQTAPADPTAVTTPTGSTTPTNPTSIATPTGSTTPADPTAVTTPTGSTTPTNPTVVTTPVPLTTPTGLSIPPVSPAPPCPLRPVVGVVQN